MASTPAHRQLHSGERLILATNGVIKRPTEAGGAFGLDGLRANIAVA